MVALFSRPASAQPTTAPKPPTSRYPDSIRNGIARAIHGDVLRELRSIGRPNDNVPMCTIRDDEIVLIQAALRLPTNGKIATIDRPCVERTMPVAHQVVSRVMLEQLEQAPSAFGGVVLKNCSVTEMAQFTGDLAAAFGYDPRYAHSSY